MLNREDILRRARILDYDRFFTPSLEMVDDPTFIYEYVQFAVHRKLDNYGYCIVHQCWKKAQKGTAFDPCIEPNEMKRKMQNNEVRARKLITTVELRNMLEKEGHPLKFKFPDGIEAIVLPKLNKYPNEVYIKWDESKELYVEQRHISFTTELHKNWFNKERATALPGKDWRFLLQLNYPDCDPINVLYSYFEGIYTGDLEELKKGNDLYNNEYGGCHQLPKGDNIKTNKPKKSREFKRRCAVTFQDKIRIKEETHAESQKQVCIKDPSGKIIRIQKYFTGPFIKKGWSFASKEEYKAQQDDIFKKRKEMAEGNIEAQLLEYKGVSRSQRRGNTKGQSGSPYQRNQTIIMEHLDEENKTVVVNYEYVPFKQETVKVKRLVPHYEYIPIVWEIKENGVVIETIPFLNDKGEPIKRKKFVENVEEWVTITRDVPTVRKTIKVLQIPSKKMKDLKEALNEDKQRKNEGAQVLSNPKSQHTKYLLGKTKNGEYRYEKILSPKEDVVPTFETYIVTKRDGFGKVVNITKRKLVKIK